MCSAALLLHVSPSQLLLHPPSWAHPQLRLRYPRQVLPTVSRTLDINVFKILLVLVLASLSVFLGLLMTYNVF
jgi:hypothetical protein